MTNKNVYFESRVPKSFFLCLEASPKDCLKKTENFYSDEQWILDFSQEFRDFYSIELGKRNQKLRDLACH